MRGKLSNVKSFFSGIGITPAYAGKTKPAGEKSSNNKDHPRVCGENRLWLVPSARTLGSPPRMRGKPCTSAFNFRFPGITPAYAGKTNLSLKLGSSPEDHPRVCGENYLEACMG